MSDALISGQLLLASSCIGDIERGFAPVPWQNKSCLHWEVLVGGSLETNLETVVLQSCFKHTDL